mmetsp:Transcript_29223/g.64665  ORF Transcript_29223/g.64665 Transcript_29223/m.64665 type:complete len:213 (-) Transcript_29223:2254-2892(-)
MGATSVGGGGGTVPRYLSRTDSSSFSSKSPTMLTSRLCVWKRLMTAPLMPSRVSASTSSWVGSLNLLSVEPSMEVMMRSAVARSRLFWMLLVLVRKACLALSMASSSQRGWVRKRCVSWNTRLRPSSPVAKWKSRMMFSSSASRAQLIRLATQNASTCSRCHLPTVPASDMVRVPTTTAPKPSGAAPSFSLALPPLAMTLSRHAFDSLSVWR